jgi:alpha-acetolactate decarboxylase
MSTIKQQKQSLNNQKMKKLFLTLVVVIFSTTLFAQGAFDKFDGQENVTSVIVNKKMFELMSKVKVDASDKDAQAYMSLLKKLDNLKVFTTNSAKPASDMKATVGSYLKSHPLDELMRVNDGGKNVKIYVKSGATSSQVKELLMFIEGVSIKGNETVLLSLTGNFDLDEISALTEKMKLPGGDSLKKASKK